MGIFGVILLALVWAFICNERTRRDKEVLIQNVYDLARNEIDAGHFGKWVGYYDALGTVSYNKHFWYRFTFRDPFKKYPESIQP